MNRKPAPAHAPIKAFWGGFIAFLIPLALVSPWAAHAEFPKLLGELTSSDRETRAKSLMRIARQREEAVSCLLLVVDSDATDDDTRHDAIALLGEHRAVSAIQVLLKHLEFAPHMCISEDIPLARYPAANALAMIGNPAAARIIEYLQRSEHPLTEQRLRIFAFILYQVDGKTLALQRLRIAHERARKGQPMENLSQLTRLLATPDFEEMRNWPKPKPRLGTRSQN